MRIETMTTRRALYERSKATEAARNPGVSKFGESLVNVNAKTDEVLTRRLKQISSEIRRMELQLNQKRKLFLRNNGLLNHDPIILVERPASPVMIKRAQTLLNNDPYDEALFGEANKPGYMKQLRSKTRTPSTLTTIDAFTVKAKKKKNVWEEAMETKEAKQFTGTVRPYARLTKREMTELQVGYEMHKPKFVADTGKGSDSETDEGMKVIQLRKEEKKPDISDSESEGSVVDQFTPFITQMASVRKKTKGQQKEHTDDEKQDITTEDSNTPRDAIKTPTAGTKAISKEVSRSVRFSSPVPVLKKRPTRPTRTKTTKISY